MMIMLRTRKRNESVENVQDTGQNSGKGRGKSHTEYEFLGGRKHVERERDFILITLELEPAE